MYINLPNPADLRGSAIEPTGRVAPHVSVDPVESDRRPPGLLGKVTGLELI